MDIATPERHAAHGDLHRAGSAASRRPTRDYARSPSLLIPLFIISLALPILFHLGPLRLSPYRVLLIVTIIPFFVMWLTGKAGRVRAPDWLILFMTFWAALSLVANHDFETAVEPGGILFIETFGSYLLARCLVRDVAAFEMMVRTLFWAIVVLIPFGIAETLTGQPVLLDLLKGAFAVHPNVEKELRWGLDRVQGPFEHPILFGVFCSACFGLSYYVLGYNKQGIIKLIRPGLVALAVFLSLSSGPLSALTVQGAIIAWEVMTRRIKNRWGILFTGFAIAYIAVDLLSNRTPLAVFSSYFAFNAQTAYSRLMIWEYGSAEVMRHPLFGIGGNDWVRHEYMTESMDMFWLVIAVRYGLPAIFCFALAALLIFQNVGNLRVNDGRLSEYRIGIMVTLVGLSIAGWTVHYWNAVYCMFMFLLGSCVWMMGSAATSNSAKEIRK